MNKQNCHTIPQFILRNFATDNGKGKVCVYRKDKQKSVRTGVKAVFAEKNLYHLLGLDAALIGQRSDEVELKLAKLEGRMAKVYKKIKTTRDEGGRLFLNEQEKDDTHKFFLLMLKRSSSFNQELRETKLPNEYANFKEKIQRNAQATGIPNDKLLSDAERIVQNYSILKLLDRPTPTPETPWIFTSGNRRAKITSIAKFHLFIKSSAEPKLVIGDYPLAEIDKVNWFPISPQIAVSENWYGCEERLELDNDFAAEFNAKIFTKSEQVAALCKKQLTALIDQDKKDC